jgi:hypothetical protein
MTAFMLLSGAFLSPDGRELRPQQPSRPIRCMPTNAITRATMNHSHIALLLSSNLLLRSWRGRRSALYPSACPSKMFQSGLYSDDGFADDCYQLTAHPLHEVENVRVFDLRPADRAQFAPESFWSCCKRSTSCWLCLRSRFALLRSEEAPKQQVLVFEQHWVAGESPTQPSISAKAEPVIPRTSVATTARYLARLM